MGCKILDLLPIRQEKNKIIINQNNQKKENYDFLGDEKYKEIYKDIFHTKEAIFNIFRKNKLHVYEDFSEFCKFIEDGIVPSTKKYNDGRYDLLKYNLPIANLSDIRNLAEKLKMMIIPVEHSNKTIMFGDDLKLSAMYDIVKSNNENLYMMCPIDYYNSYCHIKNPDKPILYIPEEFKTQFEAFDSMLPILSHLLAKVDEHDESINKLNMDVKTLSNRVDILENISREKRAEEIRRSNVAQFQYKNLDPVIFTIEGLDECKIHMLWGQDLPDILLENKNLKVFKENSKMYPNQFFEFIYPNLKNNIDENFNISNNIIDFKTNFQKTLKDELEKNYNLDIFKEIFDCESANKASEYFKNIKITNGYIYYKAYGDEIRVDIEEFPDNDVMKTIISKHIKKFEDFRHNL